ncbi:PepSY domain-containing protein [Priestia flexa]|uniref:sensor domain-containing diguanylate cyclase n=1 Tax=Priestia flexa TaxID=86664 RepID=UPI00240D6E0D|nr:PepSY domain-containing protein [Priestia flexa]WEZ07936.1 PepSY domain-containing protein [Priestia flexa]
MEEKVKASEDSKKSMYKTIWRWHFYAGILIAPFLVVLAITGGIYLFKPQIEQSLYDEYYTVEAQGEKVTAAQQTIREGNVWRGEVANRNKNGQIYWGYKTVVPLKNIEGDIVEYIAVHTDITERKRMEKQLEFEAFHDGLTRLPNREMLYQNLNNLIEKGTSGLVLLFF